MAMILSKIRRYATGCRIPNQGSKLTLQKGHGMITSLWPFYDGRCSAVYSGLSG
jgi:hypothetical protein